LFRERNQKNCIRDSHSNRHDCSHEGLNVQRGTGDQKHENYAGNYSWNCREHYQGQSHRLKICGQQKEDHDDREA
jgi:hypothetical protein